MSLSFVIPTYNRSSILATCLRALSREYEQSLAFEAIVVDDGSTDTTVRDVQTLLPELPMPTRLLRQSNRGPAFARNRGIEAAETELIVFLGDDIIVLPGYVNALWDEYQRHPGSSRGILGHTSYSRESIPTPFGRWLDSGVPLQFAYRLARVDVPLDFRLFYTSNLLVPRDAVIEAGGFNTGFTRAAYEDTDLGYRLTRNGFKLYYCPAARALHVHPASLAAFAGRMKMTARGLFDLARENPELFNLLGSPLNQSSLRGRILARIAEGLGHPVAIQLLDHVDHAREWPLPGAAYRLAMRGAFAREFRRLSRASLTG